MEVNYVYAERQRAKELAIEQRSKALEELLVKVEELKNMIDKFPAYHFPLMVEARVINSVKWLKSFEGFLKKRLGK